MKRAAVLVLLLSTVFMFCAKSPRDTLIGTWQHTQSNDQIAFCDDGRCLMASGYTEWSLSEKSPLTIIAGDSMLFSTVEIIDEETILLGGEKYRKLVYMDNIQDYFPMSENSKWEYDTTYKSPYSERKFKSTKRVTDVFEVQQHKVYRIATIYDDPDAESTSTLTRMDNTGIYQQNQTDSLEFQNLSIPFPLVYGYQWDVQSEEMAARYTFLGSTTLDLTEVSYKDVLVFKSSATGQQGMTIESTDYYVRGIGLYKSIMKLGDVATGEMVLTDYKI